MNVVFKFALNVAEFDMQLCYENEDLSFSPGTGMTGINIKQITNQYNVIDNCHWVTFTGKNDLQHHIQHNSFPDIKCLDFRLDATILFYKSGEVVKWFL